MKKKSILVTKKKLKITFRSFSSGWNVMWFDIGHGLLNVTILEEHLEWILKLTDTSKQFKIKLNKYFKIP